MKLKSSLLLYRGDNIVALAMICHKLSYYQRENARFDPSGTNNRVLLFVQG